MWLTNSAGRMSLWCLTKAPLIISTDLMAATKQTVKILSNQAAIAVRPLHKKSLELCKGSETAVCEPR